MRYDTAQLISEAITVDAIGNEEKTETVREIFVEARGVTRSEFYQAAETGLKPSAVLVLSVAEDYDGERLVAWQGKRYNVLRTYQAPGSDALELTIQEEVSDYA